MERANLKNKCLRSFAALVLLYHGAALAQHDIGAKACHAALSPIDTMIRKLAERMALASEIEDAKLKSSALHQLQVELNTLKNQYGLDALKQVERFAAEFQTKSLARAQAEQHEKEAQRNEQREVIYKWARLKKIGQKDFTVINSLKEQLLTVVEGGVLIRDLNALDQEPKLVHVPTIARDKQVLFSPDEEAIAVISQDQPKQPIQITHVALGSGALTQLPPLNPDKMPNVGFLDDGRLLVGEGDKLRLFSLPDLKPVDCRGSCFNSGHSIDYLNSNSGLGILSVNGPKIFVPNSHQAIDIQKVPDHSLGHFTLDPAANRILAVKKFSTITNSSGSGEIVSIDVKTGKVKDAELNLSDIGDIWPTGDGERLVIRQFRDRKVPILLIYNFRTKQVIPLGEVSEKFRNPRFYFQKKGPLIFVQDGDSNPLHPNTHYLIDSRTGESAELFVLGGKAVSSAEFSKAGDRIWLKFMDSREIFELK